MLKGTVRLSIRLIGPPEITIDGVPLNLNHLKARALLFYLAATGQSHTRDYLATLLWSESSASDAHHSLRSSLYHLRQALRARQTEMILSEGELLNLQPDMYDCDVIEFSRSLADGQEHDLARAVSCYRGPLLQGFTLPDAPAFDDWVQVEEARLSHAYFDALAQLADLSEIREAWGTATGYLQQMLQFDPLDESAQQRLIRLYLRQGQIGLALRQYHQFEERLQQELEISPSPETQALLYDVLRQQRSSRGSIEIPTHSPVPQPRGLPFIGRDDLLDPLSAIGQKVAAGHGTTVLLQGEGGIGKSRLVDELAAQLIAGSPPWMVLQGACSPFDNALSHGPFLDALQNGTSDDLADLLVEADTGEPDARGRFSWRLLQTVRSLTQRVPLLLIIEDLQWANSSTLNLFGFLAMRLHHLPVLLVGTVQHAEGIPALQRLIALERRRGELHLFPLTSLRRQDISELLRAYGVNQTSLETLAEWLYARSSGNPYLLSEILAQLRTEAILQPAEHGWQLNTTRWLRWRATFALPETTYDLIAWRLADLSPEARNLLNVLAVAGQALPLRVLHELSGLDLNSLSTLVDDLVARGLIVESANAFLNLPHHLLRETLIHHLSELRRRLIHQRLAEALEAQPGSQADVLLRQIALHAVAGEDIDRARRYGLRVLTDLPQEYTGAETTDFVQHLHDLLAPAASPEEMVRLTRALGILHQSLGHLEVAMGWHEQNLDWAQRAGDLTAQAEAHFEMGELALMSNDYHAAAQAAQAGLSRIENKSSTIHSPRLNSAAMVGKGHRLLGAALAMEGSDLASAEDHLHAAVTVHRRTGSQGDLCATLFELGNIAAQRGELSRALDFYDESARAAEAGRIHYYLALARNNFAYHSLLLGQAEAAQKSVAQGLQIAEAYDLLAALLHLYSTKGEIDLYLHKWKEAEESFQSGLALAEELGSLERQAGYRGGLALVARGRKDLDTARHLLEEALALIADQGYWHLRTRLQLWLAETLFEQSHYTEAGKILDEAMQVACSQQRTLLVEQGERLRTQLLALNESSHEQ